MRGRRTAALLVLLLVAGCSPGRSAEPVRPTIEVDSPVCLLDRAVHIRVTGLRAGTKVLIESTATDQDATQWQAYGSFTADAQGVVDLDRVAVADGTYDGVDGMGLFWSMQPSSGHADDRWFLLPTVEQSPSFTVRLTVRDGSGEIARRDVTRQRLAPGVTVRDLTVAGDGVVGSLFLPPADPAPRPGVLLLGGSEGSVPTSDAALLASHGYPALALGYFHQPGVPQRLKGVPVEYFAAAARLLREQPSVDPDALVVDGYSRGSEAALLLAQHYPDLIRGAILYAPNDVAGVGFPDNTGSAWTVAGKPVKPSTELNVDRLSGPVLAIAGGDDPLWDSLPQARRIMARLDATHHRFRHELLSYPAAGHVVGSHPYLPSGITLIHPVVQAKIPLGGTRAVNAAARADSWPKVLAFLDEAG